MAQTVTEIYSKLRPFIQRQINEAQGGGGRIASIVPSAVATLAVGAVVGQVAPLEVAGNQAASIYSSVTGTIGGSDIHRPHRFVVNVETDADGGTVRNVWASTIVTGTHDVATMAGFYAQTDDQRTDGYAQHSHGLVGRYYKSGVGGNVGQAAALYLDYYITGDGDIAGVYGINHNPGVVSAGNVNFAFMADFNEPVVSGTGVVVHNRGINIGAVTVGTVDNIALNIEQTGTTGNHYGIYNAGTNRLYSGGVATIGGALTAGSVTPGTNMLLGDTVVYYDNSLGSELISNPTFDSNTTGWTAHTATIASVSGGQSNNCLEITNTSSNGNSRTSITTVVGKLYRLQFYFKSGTVNGAAYYIGTTTSGSEISFTNLATAVDWRLTTAFFVATTTTTWIRLSHTGSPAGGSTIYFDEVSIKEVLGGNIQLNGYLTGYGGTSGVKVLADGRVAVGTQNPAASAALEILSTVGAVLLPRLTTTEQNALTGVDGMIIYNSSTTKFRGYAAGAWADLH